MQAKRELAEAQQQLREKVNGVKCVHNVWCVTRGTTHTQHTPTHVHTLTYHTHNILIW